MTKPIMDGKAPDRQERTTKPTSVMPISVTSHETTETITTYVNGRPIQHQEKTMIYVIEPVEEWRRTGLKEDDGREDGEIEARTWRADMWLAIWAAWAAYLVYEWRR
jgi:hypothetical protein